MSLRAKNGRLAPAALMAAVFLLAFNGCGARPAEKNPAAIAWLHDLDAALAAARERDRPLMVDFMATWCPPCKAMEDSTFSNPVVIRKASSFVTLRIDVDKQREVAVAYNANAKKYGGIGIPNILFMAGDEKRLKHIIGYYGPDSLIAVMDSVLAMK